MRDDWYGSSLRKVVGRESRIKKEEILDGVEPTDFLQAISLLHTLDKRRADIIAGKTGKAHRGGKNHYLFRRCFGRPAQWRYHHRENQL